MKYNQELPTEVEAQLDTYIERIKNIKWFAPSSEIKREDTDKQINIALEAFGVKASIEYRSLKTEKDWDAARNAARDAIWDATWDATWDAAWGAVDILALNIDAYKTKYPTGNFIHLIPLWEAGLYPCGVIDGKFVVYVPPCKTEFPSELLEPKK